MNAVDYLKAKARFCNDCRKCPLSYNNNFRQMHCGELQRKEPEVAVEIVEKWEKENPVKTYLSILLEKFPYVKRKSLGAPIYCPRDLFNIDQTCPGTSCKDCWNRECEEEE